LDHYSLRCLSCGKSYCDSTSGFLLECKENHEPAFLRTDYAAKQLTIREDNPGIFRYEDWLPIRRIISSTNRSIMFQSEFLARHLRLENLFVVFNGYWPERGAYFETCSFKELEALAVTARIPDSESNILVVSSAGNTGMAFIQVCSEKGIPLIVFIPEAAIPSMWTTREKHPAVILAALQGEADFFDAIELANSVAEQENFYPEGGAKNVARRDGMGTIVLAAVEATGRIPDHYFQAVGSGTGGIAAWEMSNRLLEDGRFGNNKTRLHFVQNEPFTIIADAWQQNSPELLPLEDKEARSRLSKVHAAILSNRKPPYSICGGVFDALSDTRGFTYTVSNSEAKEAGNLFNELEGCDLHPAAEVTVAGLIQAVEMGRINKKEIVVLNITGGGVKKLQKEGKMIPLEPDLFINRKDIAVEALVDQVREYQKIKTT